MTKMYAKNKKILVTPYKNPDLDGTACAFGYAEYLRKNGQDAQVAVFGTPHREAQFVFNTFNISPLQNADEVVDSVDGIIIVDASDLRGLSDKIKPEDVIEVIDHRKIHQAHVFPHAQVQIELVGSAATLIAEKFYATQTLISAESAQLLFSAIVSNTINFQANVTTKRDHDMANWLKKQFTCADNYVHEMFAYKSQFQKSLKETFIDDFATFTFNNQNLGIAQLEILHVHEFISDKLDHIRKLLDELKEEQNIDLIFLTCIDLEKGFNQFIVVDEHTQHCLEQALEITFTDGVCKREGILMRKEIVPLVKEVLEATGR